MTSSKFTYDPGSERPPSVVREQDIETGFIGKLQGLKYEYREDILDRATLEQNFREKFEALNRVCLTDSEFSRLLEEIITPDVFTAARTLRAMNSFTRDDGTPLNYTLVNIRDWCKNTFVDGILQRMIFDGEQFGRPHGPARPRRESLRPGRTRPASPQTRSRPRHLRTQRV